MYSTEARDLALVPRRWVLPPLWVGRPALCLLVSFGFFGSSMPHICRLPGADPPVIGHRSAISDQRSSCHRRSVGGLCYGTSYLWCRQNANASPHLQFVRQDLSRHRCRQDLRRHLCTARAGNLRNLGTGWIESLRSPIVAHGLRSFVFFFFLTVFSILAIWRYGSNTLS